MLVNLSRDYNKVRLYGEDSIDNILIEIGIVELGNKEIRNFVDDSCLGMEMYYEDYVKFKENYFNINEVKVGLFVGEKF